MRLNHDCVRDALLTLEEINTPFAPTRNFEIQEAPRMTPYSEEEILYTIQTLNSANFIDAKVLRFSGSGYDLIIDSITWDGHQFLDTIRDESVWSETKKRTSRFTSVGLQLISQVASGILVELIKGKI
ncbi:DUF2513 domain-containing protein [Exiguobacterium sp. s70]|uniref:DUF2513 domain-containing protein n=1 Tax=Exiguobacterium sp. s70 TaxID=2751228 RepID=UPI001BE63059|nr:DUF2513 domain-containing protein [Exiguobacterium sp. s70]